MAALILSGATRARAEPAAPESITVTVYRDYNASGAQDTGEPGVSGVTVTAYPASATGSTGAIVATGGVNGAYSLATGAGNYRIEVTNLPAYLRAGAQGATTTTFLADGGSVSIGLNNPADYSQTDPFLVVPDYVFGAHDHVGNASWSTLQSVNYAWGTNTGPSSATPWETPPPNDVAFSPEIGSTWGVAWDRTNNYVYAAAYHKQFTDYGPGGPGMIYRIPVDPKTGLATGTPTQWADVADMNGQTVCGAHTTDIEWAPSNDDAVFDQVGKCSLGDLDISEDDQFLYVVNLANKRLLQIRTADGALNNNWSIPTNQTNCTGDPTDIRPFGLGIKDGIVYVGSVCSRETEEYPYTPSNYPQNRPMRLYVNTLNPVSGTWGEVMNVNVPYSWDREWTPWMSNAANLLLAQNGDYVGWASMMLSDIEFYGNDMTLGIRDRTADQWGVNIPVGSDFVTATPWGDVLCATPNGSTYALESNQSCGNRTANPLNRDNYSGSADQQFYWGDGANVDSDTPGFHHEASMGGLAQVLTQPLAMTALTPPNAFDNSFANAGGLLWLNNVSGAPTRGHLVYYDGNYLPQFGDDHGRFSKANGLGDLEALSYPAPLEIGNRLWCDTGASGVGAGNGVQDPGETVIPGAIVTLQCDTNGSPATFEATATATTDANGLYLFKDSAGNITSANGWPAAWWDNAVSIIPRGAQCRLLVAPAQSAVTAACGSGVAPTTPNTGGVDAGADLRDSDGLPNVDGLGNSGLTLVTGSSGENNHNYDFGFALAATLYDWGDLPDGPYNTDSTGTAGPSHVIISGLQMGANIDDETDGQPNATATGDDANGTPDDEDGVTLPPSIVAGSSVDFDVNVTNTTGGPATLYGFVDWNNNGSFGDTGEAVSQPVPDGTNGGAIPLTFSVPAGATTGTNLGARFRLSTDTGLGPDGPATDGEVEDYLVTVTARQSDLEILKQASDAGVTAGSTLTYTLTITNNGPDGATGVIVTDQLPAGSDFISATPSQGGPCTESGGTVTCNMGNMANGAVATVTVVITANEPIPPQSSSGSDPDYRTLERIAPTVGQGWDTSSTGPQTFANWRNSGVEVTFTYSDNMWDDIPVIYVNPGDPGVPGWSGDTSDHCSPDYNGSLRWTNNIDATTPPGTPGTATGTATMRIDFDQLVYLQELELGSLSRINFINEWVLVRAYDSADNLVAIDTLSSTNYTCQGTTPPNAEYGETAPGSKIYYARGLADQDVEEYNHLTTSYTSTPIDYVIAEFWTSATSNTTFDDAYANPDDIGSITINTLTVAPVVCEADEILNRSFVMADETDPTPSNNEDDVCVQVLVPRAELSIGSTVFADANDNGRQDGSEAGIAGVGVELFTSTQTPGTDTPIATDTTDADGDYFFDGLADGDYVVYIPTPPAGAPTASSVVDTNDNQEDGDNNGNQPGGSGTPVTSPVITLAVGTEPVNGAGANDEADQGANTTGDNQDDANDADGDMTVDFGFVAAPAPICTSATYTLDWRDIGITTGAHPGSPFVATNVGGSGIDITITYTQQSDDTGYLESPDTSRISPYNPYYENPVVTNDGEVLRWYFDPASDAGAPPTLDNTIISFSAPVQIDEILFGGERDFGERSASSITAYDGTGGTGSVVLPVGVAPGSTANFTHPNPIDQNAALNIMTSALGTSFSGYDNTGADAGSYVIIGNSGGSNRPWNIVNYNNATVQSIKWEHFGTDSTDPAAARDNLAEAEFYSAYLSNFSFTVADLCEYGDLPDADGATNPNGPEYNTDSIGDKGAAHVLDANLFIGAATDLEFDGQPSAAADGDDLGSAPPDDEDGVTLPTFVAGQSATVSVNVTNNTGSNATLYGFIDFDGDGAFTGTGETTTATVTDGTTGGTATLTFNVPANADSTQELGARFRLSTDTGLGPDGAATDGEVEDYLIQVNDELIDWGDLPDGPYNTDSAGTAGPSHVIVSGLQMGANIDAEADGQPTATATGDDANGTPDDEDGVTLPPFIVAGNSVDFDVDVTNTTGGPATLYGFVDWNNDGSFDDTGEAVSQPVPDGANGIITLTFNVPVGATTGTNLGARFRLSTDTGLGPDGPATDGEVEDYLVQVGAPQPSLAIRKVLNTPEPVRLGDPVSFTIIITNTGPTTINVLPLVDAYDKSYLSYQGALPTPNNNASDGTLNWTDLTVKYGFDVPPSVAIPVVVHFIAIRDTSLLPNGATVNYAAVSGAVDESGATPPDVSDSEDVIINAPTGVFFADRGARRSGAVVHLRWTTLDETAIAAFNVIRTDSDGTEIVLTADVIVAQFAGLSQGASYVFTDADLTNQSTVHYDLEVIGLDGTVSRLDLGRIHAGATSYLPLLTR